MTEKEEVKNQSEVVELLNRILNGEKMAVEVYSHYLDQIETEQINDLLNQFKQDHQEHINQLTDRIKSLGDSPEEDSALGKLVSETMLEIGDLLGGASEIEILNKVYEGEDKGINQVEEQLKEKLDSESQALVDEMLATDKQHLEKLKELINSFE